MRSRNDSNMAKLQASASAPVLAATETRTHGAVFAHSERVARQAPPLALLPLEQLKAQQRQREAQRNEELRRDDAAQRQQRLGERFMGMMATLARLRSVELGDQTEEEAQRPSRKKVQAPRRKSSMMETLTERRNEAPSAKRESEPVVNEATAPLREHLTFAISMLLPAPMDSRQSALHSSIDREKKRTRLRRRRKLRRKKRPTGATYVDGRRMWHTSHVTWVPSASVDYVKARKAEEDAASEGSRLVAKFKALAVERRGAERKRHVYAVEDRWRKEERREELRDELSDEGGDEEEEEEEEEEAEEGQANEEEEDDDEEEEERQDTLPVLRATATLEPPRVYRSSARASSLARPMQTHQAAWLSPELRRWLLATGLFAARSSSSSSSS